MKKIYFVSLLLCLLAEGAFAQCPRPAPTAISGPTTNLCRVRTVSYTVSPVPGATSYHWTPPAGFVILSGQGEATLTVNTPATFTSGFMQITATNDCGSSDALAVALTGAPGNLSDQMTGPSQVVVGSTNVYSLPLIDGLSYSWVADGSSVVGGWGTNSVSIKSGSINGNVKATVKNTCGTGPVAQKFVTVSTTCIAPEDITGPTYDLCGGKTVTYTAATSPGATSYQWTIPAGFTLVSGQGTQTLKIKAPSTFTTATLQVAAVGSCGTSPKTSLSLNGAPGDLSAEIAGPSEVVAQSTNVYSLPAATGLSYSWVADGGSVVGGWGTNSVSIKAGTISGFVKVTVKNACGTAPVAKKAFTVTPVDCSSLKVTGTITNYQCPDADGTIVLNVAGGTAPYTYQWQGQNFTSTSKDVTVENGEYTVTVTSANGCTAAESFFVYNEFPELEPPYPITGPTNNLCGSKTVTYTATTTPGATAYHWNVPAGFTVISGQGTKTITLKTPENFDGAFLRVSADVPCGNTGDKASLTLTGTPSSYIAATEMNGPEEVVAGSINNYNLYFYTQPPTGISYSWTADGGSVVGGWGSTSVDVKAGSISGYVKVMGTNSCGTGLINKKAFQIVPASARLASSSRLEMLKTSFSVYPNPVHDQATVVFEAEAKDKKFEIKVIDMYGKVLMAKQGTAVAGVNTLQLTLGKYAKGIYMVNLITGDKSKTIKLVKGN